MLILVGIVYQLLMGAVQGLTNLGGPLLAILAGYTTKNKISTRYTIAYYYLFFTLVQIFILVFIVNYPHLTYKNLSTALVSALIYQIIGNRIFLYANNKVYKNILNIFIFICGVAILLNA